MKQVGKLIVRFLFVFGLLLAPISARAAGVQEETWRGWFQIRWGDRADGQFQARYILQSEDGQSFNLNINEATARSIGDLSALDRKQITVVGQSETQADGAPAIQVESLALAEFQSAPGRPEVSGAQPWVTVMCKFSDDAAEPKNLAYFQNMYSSSYPGMDHYWRENSYNIANVSGSTAVGWYVLPQPRSYYVYNNALDFDRAATDCTATADAVINYTQFQGINLMFNGDLDGYAWGGAHYLTLDGVSRSWYMTWEPPWGYADITVISHEMGHGFGLPHSSGQYGQTYDNRWDVMSDTWTDCGNSSHGTYGCLGQGTISYHKDRLGWITGAKKYTAPGGAHTIWLERLALPQTGNYLMAQIPVGGSSTVFYTVEVRQKVGYDVKLPGKAVIIHKVDFSNTNTAQVIDIDGNGNTGDAGAMWIAGETFTDSTNNISVSVLAESATGFQVSITSPQTAPLSFSKISPTFGDLLGLSTTLKWQVSSNATGYEYCIDQTDDNTCSNWISTGTQTSVALNNLVANATYYWHVRATNALGTTYAGGDPIYFSWFVPRKINNATFSSMAVQDGGILESTETSNAGGALDDSASFKLGDDYKNRQYRAILSFNTFSIPDTAVITSATLKILKTGGFAGTNPFTTHGYLWADLAKPFGSSGALELSDFNAAAAVNKAGAFTKTASSGWHTSKLISAGLAQINLTGITQFRLRFALDDNDDAGADFVSFYSGNESVAANRPVLVLEFYVP